MTTPAITFIDFWYDYWMLFLLAFTLIILVVIVISISVTRKKEKKRKQMEQAVKKPEEDVFEEMNKELSKVSQEDGIDAENNGSVSEEKESTATVETAERAREYDAEEANALRADLAADGEEAVEEMLRRYQRQYDSLSEELKADMAANKKKKGSRTLDQKLYEAQPELKDIYSMFKNLFLSHSYLGKKRKVVKSRMARRVETFKTGKVKIARLTVAGKSLKVFLALDSGAYEVEKYHHKDFSHKKSYVPTPMMIKIRSKASIKRACKLIEDMMGPIEYMIRADYQPVDYAALYTLPEKNALESIERTDRIIETASIVSANNAITDEETMTLIVDMREKDADGSPVTDPKAVEAHVSTDQLHENFEKGKVVDLSSLKLCGLVPKDTTFVKVVSKGKLSKPLSVKVNDITIDAAKMIIMTGGQVVLMDSNPKLTKPFIDESQKKEKAKKTKADKPALEDKPAEGAAAEAKPDNTETPAQPAESRKKAAKKAPKEVKEVALEDEKNILS